jgi:PIN domain nuclease of toxin-antitoxin system
MQSSGVLALPVSPSHALHVATLPYHHRDPFDRLLIAQAQLERLPVLTVDRQFAAYDLQVRWAD